MPPPVAASRNMPVSLLSAVTTGTGTGVVIPSNVKGFNIIVKGSGVISSGTMILEEASAYDYAGLWSQLASVDMSTLTGDDEQVYHFEGRTGAVRARMSANIVGGGTASATLVTF